jgi:ActR/RegA family two-component response regulator
MVGGLPPMDEVRRAAEAFKLGAREYLVKPLDVACMLEAVREAIASPPCHGRSPVILVEIGFLGAPFPT